MVTVRDLKVVIATAVVVVAGMSFTRAQTPVLSSRIFDWDSLKVQKTNVGFRRDVVRSPTVTLDELEMHITTLNAGLESHPPHQHAAEELLIIKEGTLEALVNGDTARSGPVRSCSRRRISRTPSRTSAPARDLPRHPVAVSRDDEKIANPESLIADPWSLSRIPILGR